jgi:hypothetical protein
MSRLKRFTKLATEFVEFMAKPSDKSAAGPGRVHSAFDEAVRLQVQSARPKTRTSSGTTKAAQPSGRANADHAQPGQAQRRRTPTRTKDSRDQQQPPATRPKDTSGPLEVSYAPEADGEPDPGEVVWTYVSYEDDPSQGKDRPVAVIGWDGPVLGVVQLTSKDHRRNDCVPIGTGDWDREHRPSFAKIDRILRVKPADVRREGAVIGRGSFQQPHQGTSGDARLAVGHQ